MGHEFNQKVNNLPSSLTHLIFGYCFNQEVNNLPSSLTHLVLGHCFNEPVDSLPSTLLFLAFPKEEPYICGKCNFNHKLDKHPVSLTHLSLSDNFNSYFHFPPFLTRLQLPRTCSPLLQSLPSSITHLFAFDLPPGSLPPHLTHLDFYSAFSVFNLPLYSNSSQFNNNGCLLPSSLTHLKLGKQFKQPLNNFPSSLTHLFICTPGIESHSTIFLSLSFSPYLSSFSQVPCK